MNTSLKLSKQLSFGEEIANSVTHAVGAVIMLILLPIFVLVNESLIESFTFLVNDR